jgi:SAM-dependent methyltransferase
MPSSEYDSFADIYSVWTDTAGATRANLPFYLDAYAKAEGPVVELGVGDGRIAVQAAVRGCTLIGVDSSPAMLDLCRRRAENAGVGERLTLLRADFRSFELHTPAALIALPYHSIGHLPSLEDKRSAIAHVYSQLRPGGCFLFDDFVMTPKLMAQMRTVQLRAEYRTASGAEALLWVTSLVNEPAQTIRVVTWEDELNAQGMMRQRRYRRLSLSWLTPAQARELLVAAGFTVEACYGNFDRTPFAEATAQEQIWLARRPGPQETGR